MTFDELVRSMNPEMYQSLKQAIELGKWPDGKTLDEGQKKICMRALIVYENRHLDMSQRTGFMSSQACASKGKSVQKIDTESPIKWL